MTNPEQPEDPNFASYTRRLKEELSVYLELRLTYLRLQAYEKIARAGGLSVVFLFIAITAGGFFLFASVAAAMYLGEIFQDRIIGFLLVTAVYLIITIILILQRKAIALVINNAITGVLLKDYEQDKASKAAEKGPGRLNESKEARQ